MISGNTPQVEIKLYRDLKSFGTPKSLCVGCCCGCWVMPIGDNDDYDDDDDHNDDDDGDDDDDAAEDDDDDDGDSDGGGDGDDNDDDDDDDTGDDDDDNHSNDADDDNDNDDDDGIEAPPEARSLPLTYSTRCLTTLRPSCSTHLRRKPTERERTIQRKLLPVVLTWREHPQGCTLLILSESTASLGNSMAGTVSDANPITKWRSSCSCVLRVL